MSVNDSQLSKAESPNFIILSDSFTFFNEEQSEKASHPICVTLLGIVISSNRS